MRHRHIVVLFLIVLAIPLSSVHATSGACSSHNGVNCAMGMQPDGTVYCNDNWIGSETYYDYTVECQNNDALFKALLNAPPIGSFPIVYESTTDLCIERLGSSYSRECYANDSAMPPIPICPTNASFAWNLNYSQEYCLCNSGYHITSQNGKGFCAPGMQQPTNNFECKQKYGENSDMLKVPDSTGNPCGCFFGDQWNSDETACVPVVCPAHARTFGTSACVCTGGYVSDNNGQCIVPQSQVVAQSVVTTTKQVKNTPAPDTASQRPPITFAQLGISTTSIPQESGGFWSGLLHILNPFSWF